MTLSIMLVQAVVITNHGWNPIVDLDHARDVEFLWGFKNRHMNPNPSPRIEVMRGKGG
jgi:hypothetical protein